MLHWILWVLGAFLLGWAIVTTPGVIIWMAAILLLIGGFVAYRRAEAEQATSRVEGSD